MHLAARGSSSSIILNICSLILRISEATDVSRDTLRARADKPNIRSVIENLEDSGVVEEFDEEPKGAKNSKFLPAL